MVVRSDGQVNGAGALASHPVHGLPIAEPEQQRSLKSAFQGLKTKMNLLSSSSRKKVSSLANGYFPAGRQQGNTRQLLDLKRRFWNGSYQVFTSFTAMSQNALIIGLSIFFSAVQTPTVKGVSSGRTFSMTTWS